ncbi:ATP-grasp enzyme [Pseudonocardia xishanensis]|uniref:ATP-grasp superfamily ATP-dependent carboligase n=1 Tax=Pseudonocardia xishanensis TaxID=630995 RepID=A0ABP8RQP4_9PSEU
MTRLLEDTRARPTAPAARATARTLGALALLTAALPVDLLVTGAAALVGAVRRERRETPERPLTVLVSGGKMTKALALARAFHKAGHRVVLVEQARYRFGAHRFSRAVAAFHTVPAPDAPDYVERLVEIAEAEGADVYVPVCSPLASRFDAEARRALEPFCEVVHPDAETVAMLDDKHRFAETAAGLGLSVPDTHRITDPRQIVDFACPPGRHYVAKSIAYDPVRRMDLTRLPRPTREETERFAWSLPISEDTPWILQEYVEGTEYCTHSTVRDGRVQLHCCCPSSGFQLNYAMVEHPAIEEWVRRFVGAIGATGQLSFDLMETPDGRLYALECNPRTHSAITMFYDHPGVAAAYLDADVPTVLPTARSRPTYWLHHELALLVRHPTTVVERARIVWRGKEALLEAWDPLPFLLLPHLQITTLLLGALRRGRRWVKIDFNIGKLVEPAGD